LVIIIVNENFMVTTPDKLDL